MRIITINGGCVFSLNKPIRLLTCGTFLAPLIRCPDGFVGPRCEFKDLDGTYLRKYSY